MPTLIGRDANEVTCPLETAMPSYLAPPLPFDPMRDQYVGNARQRQLDAAYNQFTVHSLMPDAARRFVRAVIVLPSMHGTTLFTEPDGNELRIIADNPTFDQKIRLKELAKVYEEGIAAGCEMCRVIVMDE